MLDLTPYHEAIADFACRWQVKELALFGSALREDFGPESDVDILLSFEDGEQWSLFDLAVMREELAALFGREVDIVEPAAVRNPFFRRSILDRQHVVYAS